MDEFTKRHLREYAEAVCFDDERDEFIAFVESLDDDDIQYFADTAGWPPALSHFRSVSQPQRILDEQRAYDEYRAACEEENLDAHGIEMWRVHDRPVGPLG